MTPIKTAIGANTSNSFGTIGESLGVVNSQTEVLPMNADIKVIKSKGSSAIVNLFDMI